MRNTLFALAALALTGCQTWGPTWSEVTGTMYTRPTTTMYLKPAIIEQIDGSGAFVSNPIKITPGTHQMVLQGPAPARPGGSLLKEYTLVAEPCKRYYINAQFENPVENKWTPVVDAVIDIAGCTVPAKG
jgi:hypothetical protein